MNPLLLLFGAGIVVAAAASRASGTVTAWLADLAPTGAPPQPPSGNDNGFRVGPQPDPAAPSDPNRGRYFGMFGQSRHEGSVAEHDALLLDFPIDARGTFELVVWAARAGKPERCTRWTASARVEGGRIVSQSWGIASKCGTQHATWTDPGGCNVTMPLVRLEQRGPTLALLWTTSVSNSSDWGDSSCDENLTFYVDVFWRFRPIGTTSGASRNG